MTDALKPCPFCGAGKTDIHPNGRMWTGQRLSEPTSVSIRHWCEDVPGQPHRMIERVGRDEASAIAAWNSRAAIAAPPGWTDADADAARLALELECLLTDKAMPMETVSRWWDSAHEALELHRARMAAAPDAQKGAA